MIDIDKLAASLAKPPVVKDAPAVYGAPKRKYGKPAETSPQVASLVEKIVKESLGGTGGP